MTRLYLSVALAFILCSYLALGELADTGVCTGYPKMHNGKPCASTTRYWDGQKGACGCGGSDTDPFSWQWNKGTAAASAPIFGSGTWCGTGCGKCFKLTPTAAGASPLGRGAPDLTSLVVKVTNLCPYAGNEAWCAYDINSHGYEAHFDLMDYNMAGIISNMGWDNPEVTYEEVDCATNGYNDWNCECQNHASKNISTQAPTAAPVTEAPTEAPTEEPTEAATEAPVTEAPTEAPTEEPTEEPTEAPTEEPTEAPTEEPTEAPTEEPATEAPTEEPTEAPVTEAPTEEPTEAPATHAPTHKPRPTPSKAATSRPTEAPTEEAPVTEAPTEEPVTEEPTTEAPVTEEPATEAPVTEEPTTEVPATEEPTTEAPVAGPITIQLNGGSNAWWLGFSVVSDVSNIAKVEIMDSGRALSSWTRMSFEGNAWWNMFSINPEGQQMQAPLSLRFTSTSGDVVVADDIITTFQAATVDTGVAL